MRFCLYREGEGPTQADSSATAGTLEIFSVGETELGVFGILEEAWTAAASRDPRDCIEAAEAALTDLASGKQETVQVSYQPALWASLWRTPVAAKS